jgi:hypothetical protein
MWFFVFQMKKSPKVYFLLLVFSGILCFTSCSPKKSPLFKKLSVSHTQIDFNNRIVESDTFNILTNEYIFNGGGVAVADFDNDGFSDLFFSGNQVENKLYLNKGDLKFQEVSQKTQTTAPNKWSTGIAVADINRDGWMDIYVCAAMLENNRNNMLFVHQGLDENGIPIFKEQAQQFGIADSSNSMTASFLDYNKDGYLDLYVVNNEQSEINPNNFRKKITNGTAVSNDRLYRNNKDGTFTNVSKEAGILTEGFGLSVSVSDFNNDSWPDIYITNDYLTNDILYINQQDGTFKNEIEKFIPHQSKFSMGSDVGDINNDGYLDLITLDMLGETNQRKKTTISSSSYFQNQLNNRWGYQDQHIRNMLFVGNGAGTPFSEVGQFAGVYQTDWSWSPLFADLDHDGLKDLLVTNGFPRDITDMDFANYRMEVQRYVSAGRLLDSIPIVKIPNYAFKNQGSIRFDDRTEDWGLNIPSFSNGAVYADLDLDGDLDYVVSNINDPAFVFENSLEYEQTQFLQINLNGSKENPSTLGSKIVLYFDDDSFQLYECYTSKGYLSSLEGIAYFGFPKDKKVSHVEVLWPDGKWSSIDQLTINTRIQIEHASAKTVTPNKIQFPLTEKRTPKKYREVSSEYGIDYMHRESEVNDFAFQRLLLRSLSKNDPKIKVGDLNNDGLEDFILSSSRGFSPELFLQKESGQFVNSALFSEENDLKFEVEDIALFDLEKDGDLDLYLVSGGQHQREERYLKDRLLVNNGQAQFSEIELDLPTASNGSLVATVDYNGDGYQDLFVGARNKPLQFPMSDQSVLIRNDQGVLKLDTKQPDSLFHDLGMVSDAKWVDIDGDQDQDLVVVGEFSPIQIFVNEAGSFQKVINPELEQNKGLWRSIAVLDKDQDGDQDLILGNFGSNNRYNISPKTPMELFAVDVDQNGTVDPILFTYQKDVEGTFKSYPLQFWKNLIQQSPYFRQKFNRFKSFSKATQEEFLKDEVFQGAQVLEVNQERTVFVENLRGGQFQVRPLEDKAQWGPVNSILIDSTSIDQETQVFMVGNDLGGNPFEGNQDAFSGLLLTMAKEGFEYKEFPTLGFENLGYATDVKKIKVKGGALILVAQNNGKLKAFKRKSP